MSGYERFDRWKQLRKQECALRQPGLPRWIIGIDLPEMGRRRDGGTGPGGTLGSAPDGTEVEVRTHLLPRDYDILGSESDMDRRIRAFFPLRLMRVGAPRPRLALADQPTRTLGAQV